MHEFPKDKIIYYFETNLKFKLKPGKNYKRKYGPSIVVQPSFLSTMHYANHDIEKIRNHAEKVAEIAAMYNLSLQFYENYFLLRLNTHLDKESALIDFFQGFIFCFFPLYAILIIITFAPKTVTNVIFLKLLSSLPDILPIVSFILSIVFTLASLCIRSFYKRRSATESLEYRYCILVLKRAQELLENPI